MCLYRCVERGISRFNEAPAKSGGEWVVVETPTLWKHLLQ